MIEVRKKEKETTESRSNEEFIAERMASLKEVNELAPYFLEDHSGNPAEKLRSLGYEGVEGGYVNTNTKVFYSMKEINNVVMNSPEKQN